MKTFRILATIAGLLLILILFKLWLFERPPVNLRSLSKLQPGISQRDVERAIGKPSNISDDGQTWAYSRSSGWGIVYVRFDTNKALRNYDYDP